MNVCLSVCSLCIWAHYMPVQPNFPGILLSSRRRSRGTFFPEIVGPLPPKRIPLFLTNRIAAFLGIRDLLYRTTRSRRGQVAIGFRGWWVRIWDPIGLNPIGRLRANRNWSFGKLANLDGIFRGNRLLGVSNGGEFEPDVHSPRNSFDWIRTNRNQAAEKITHFYECFTKTLFLGFLQAAKSNTISICLGIIGISRKLTESELSGTVRALWDRREKGSRNAKPNEPET